MPTATRRRYGGLRRYDWRGFVDKTNGNYLVIFALPTIFSPGRALLGRGQSHFLEALLLFRHSRFCDLEL